MVGPKSRHDFRHCQHRHQRVHPCIGKKVKLSKTLEIVRAEGDQALAMIFLFATRPISPSSTQLIRWKEVAEDARSLEFVQAVLALVEAKENISRNELSGQWSILNTAIDGSPKKYLLRHSNQWIFNFGPFRAFSQQTVQGLSWWCCSSQLGMCYFFFVFYSVFVKPLRFIEKQIRNIDNEEIRAKKSLVSQISEMQTLQATIQRLRTTTADNKACRRPSDVK